MIVLSFIIVVVGLSLGYYLWIRQQKKIDELRSIIESLEKERSSIAEDLHEDLGATVSAIKLRMNNPQHTEHLKETNEQLDSVVREIRIISRRLSGPAS